MSFTVTKWGQFDGLALPDYDLALFSLRPTILKNVHQVLL
jgi:hypothetical protein